MTDFLLVATLLSYLIALLGWDLPSTRANAAVTWTAVTVGYAVHLTVQ